MRQFKKRAGYVFHRLPRSFVPRHLSVKRVGLVEGLPPGLDPDLVHEIGATHLGQRAEQVYYEHLSNWKPTGAYRITMQSRSRQSWSVIFKNADYGTDSVPAQKTLPITLGRPEYRIMCAADDVELGNYLPEILWRHHHAGEQRYEYLMEDLGRRWYRPTTRGDWLAAARVIPSLHMALRSSVPSETDDLVRYDPSYSHALRTYVEMNVPLYLNARPHPGAMQLWQKWAEIASIHEEAMPSHDLATQPIHGDFNPWNLYLYWRDRNRLKAVDWEWAGVGFPHVDLASLLKHADLDVQRRGVEEYALADPRLSPAEHKETYLWCRLQDAIRDAGYVAAQLHSFSHVPQADPSRYIAASLNRAVHASRALSA